MFVGVSVSVNIRRHTLKLIDRLFITIQFLFCNQSLECVLLVSSRAPTRSPTPPACQTTPSPEPATCGPLWSLHATPPPTTILMRSPPRTAPKMLRAKRTPLKGYQRVAGCWAFPHTRWRKVEEGGEEDDGEHRAHKLWVQPNTRGHCGGSQGTTHTLACTVCVCVCTYTSRARQPVQSRDRLHICLNANRLPELQHLDVFCTRSEKLNSCFYVHLFITLCKCFLPQVVLKVITAYDLRVT